MRYASFSMPLTLLSVLLSAAAQADSSSGSGSPQELEPLLVSASRSQQSIAEIAGTLYRIERAEIAQQSTPGRSTAEILGQLVPSLAPSSGTTSNYGMTMRGRNVLVMIDGVPMSGSRDGARQLNSISPEMIERIEVVSGASSLYGAGASGGIINLISRRADAQSLALSSKIGVRTANQPSTDSMAYQGTQTIAFNQGTLRGFAGLSFLQQGALNDSNGQRIGPEIAQTDRQDTRTLDFNGRLEWQIDSLQQLSTGLRYYDDQQDSQYGPDYGPNLRALFVPNYQPSHQAVKGLHLDEQPRTLHQGINLQYQHADLFSQSFNSEAYYRKEQARWFPSVAAVVHPALPGGFTYAALQSNTTIEVWGLRSALHKELEVAERALSLSYGLDLEREQDSQQGQSYNLAQFIASNGLNYVAGPKYAMGPDVTIDKSGLFLQADYALTERLSLQAGVRRERIAQQIDDSTPYAEAITADRRAGYAPRNLAGGSIRHSQTLFNLGTVYQLNNAQQLFAHFSQGFSLPDTQRMLRDVPANFVIDSNSIDPIKVNNYELGWRMQGESGLNAGFSAFYNNSDKVVQFNRDYSVSVADTDERVWGAEAHLDYPLNEHLRLGGTLAYTRGQYRDAAEHWRELNAFRIAPLKATSYADWDFAEGYGLRLQSLTVGGTERAYEDAQHAAISPNIRASAAAKIQGYTVFDLIAHAPWFGGQVDLGIYNLANRDYQTVYSQQAGATYGKLSSLPAQGRTFAVSYAVSY